jgi:putative ATPase
MDLFEYSGKKRADRNAPLADRMRPRTLDEFIGQSHIVGKGRLLRRAIMIDQLSSILLYGPPGTGKTTLAWIIANTTRAEYLSINAVLAGKKDIKDAIDTAKRVLNEYGRRTILFIDEVHRFNKSQQDALLPHVEKGVLILIGATTENPYFEVNKALVSRSMIFELKSLDKEDLQRIARNALEDRERGLGHKNITIRDDALSHLVDTANGDARNVLNALELAAETTEPDPHSGRIVLTRDIVEESIQKRAVLYDKDGDVHYDTVSAFIKSLRGSDPDAALYWMARMVYAGEDPRFIFRRMLIFASEDIGLADPQALMVVESCARAFDYVGMPEGRFHLAHACLYCATAEKSNSTMAFFDALSNVQQESREDIPSHLRDPSRDNEGLGHGKGYVYPHAYREHWVAQQYLPAFLQGKVFYQPGAHGREKHVKDTVERRRRLQLAAMQQGQAGTDFSAYGEQDVDGVAGQDVRSQWHARIEKYERLVDITDTFCSLADPGRQSLITVVHSSAAFLVPEIAARYEQARVEWLVERQVPAEPLPSQVHVIVRRQKSDTCAQWIDACEYHATPCILVHGMLQTVKDKTGCRHRMCDMLSAPGVLVFSLLVPAEGTRLSSLVRFPDNDPHLREVFVAAEERAFSASDDTMGNRSPEDIAASIRTYCEDASAQTDGLRGAYRREKIRTHGDGAAEACEQAGACSVTVHRRQYRITRRITGSMISRWFDEGRRSGERVPFGTRLRQYGDAETVEAIQRVLLAQLKDREVAWERVVAFVKVERG